MEEKTFNCKPFGAGAIAFAMTGDALVALAVVGGLYYYSKITTDIQPIYAWTKTQEDLNAVVIAPNLLLQHRRTYHQFQPPTTQTSLFFIMPVAKFGDLGKKAKGKKPPYAAQRSICFSSPTFHNPSHALGLCFTLLTGHQQQTSSRRTATMTTPCASRTRAVPS